MISYNKLWILLEKRGMKKTDLKEVIAASTLAKLGKNEIVSTAVIEKICNFLDCQPGDIMEYINEKKMGEFAKQIDDTLKSIIEPMKAQGLSKEQFANLIKNNLSDFLLDIYDNQNVTQNAINEIKDNSKNE